MKRGDVVIVSLPGDYGKPRPALVLQSDLFNDSPPSVTVAPVTTTIVDAPLFRVTVDPSAQNGLRAVSQVMVDKLTTVRRTRITRSVGRLSDDTLVRVDRAMMLWLGIAV